MTLDNTERVVTLFVDQNYSSGRVEVFKKQLEKVGFEVRIDTKPDLNAIVLSTEVGRFVGERSIRGFVKGYEKIFATVHKELQQLAV